MMFSMHECNLVYRIMTFIQMHAFQHVNLQMINNMEKNSNFSVHLMEYFVETILSF